MLKLEVIGNLGGDAVVSEINGKKYITFNVAHSERESTTWVSVFLDVHRQNVAQYLVRGTKVYVRGRCWLRVYDSAKYHCKMAGISMWADDLELCGGGSPHDDKEESLPNADDLAMSMGPVNGNNGEEAPLPF